MERFSGAKQVGLHQFIPLLIESFPNLNLISSKFRFTSASKFLARFPFPFFVFLFLFLFFFSFSFYLAQHSKILGRQPKQEGSFYKFCQSEKLGPSPPCHLVF
jgi:hypothetical protein